MDFTKMDINTVALGTRGDGVRYLRLFLQEYTSLFNERVNPGCPKCLTHYLNRYKNYYAQMKNKSEYRLHAKYENIPLEFGSPILVNNGNITPEYAKKLLEQKNGERYFANIPADEEIAALKPKRKKPAAASPKKEPGKGLESNDTEVFGNVQQ